MQPHHAPAGRTGPSQRDRAVLTTGPHTGIGGLAGPTLRTEHRRRPASATGHFCRTLPRWHKPLPGPGPSGAWAPAHASSWPAQTPTSPLHPQAFRTGRCTASCPQQTGSRQTVSQNLVGWAREPQRWALGPETAPQKDRKVPLRGQATPLSPLPGHGAARVKADSSYFSSGTTGGSAPPGQCRDRSVPAGLSRLECLRNLEWIPNPPVFPSAEGCRRGGQPLWFPPLAFHFLRPKAVKGGDVTPPNREGEKENQKNTERRAGAGDTSLGDDF